MVFMPNRYAKAGRSACVRATLRSCPQAFARWRNKSAYWVPAGHQARCHEGAIRKNAPFTALKPNAGFAQVISGWKEIAKVTFEAMQNINLGRVVLPHADTRRGSKVDGRPNPRLRQITASALRRHGKKGGVPPALILVGCTGTRYELQKIKPS